MLPMLIAVKMGQNPWANLAHHGFGLEKEGIFSFSLETKSNPPTTQPTRVEPLVGQVGPPTPPKN